MMHKRKVSDRRSKDRRKKVVDIESEKRKDKRREEKERRGINK